MNGVGGQEIGGVYGAGVPRGHVQIDENDDGDATDEDDGVRTGGDDDHVRNNGTSGNASKRRVRDRMSEKGIMGRWIKACHGQLLGSSVRRRLYISSPRNSFTANAPYDVATTYIAVRLG